MYLCAWSAHTTAQLHKQNTDRTVPTLWSCGPYMLAARFSLPNGTGLFDWIQSYLLPARAKMEKHRSLILMRMLAPWQARLWRVA